MKQTKEESVKLYLDFYDKYTWPLEIAETLLEVRQYLTESTILSLFQNFYFSHKGQRINEYSEFSIPDGGKLQVLLDEFNERTARFHLRRVQEIIANLSHYQYLCKGKNQNEDSLSLKEIGDLQLNDILQPAIKPNLLLNDDNKAIKQNVQQLGLSSFNPPPLSRKLKGDLFYIVLKTIESVELIITASNLGFYVNSSQGRTFEPTQKSDCYYNLIDLIVDQSPSFKKELINAIPEQQQPALPATIKYNHKWLSVPEHPQTLDHQRSESWALDLHGFDISSLRDWNEELQVFRSLPKMDLIQKLNRDKALSKVYGDFVEAAVRGACAVVDKIIQPLNPMDIECQQVYVYNQIFFSFAMETPEDFRQESGPDATPTVSTTNCDFRNLQILHKLDIPGLSVLNTCLVDYKGRRVIAQSIIPGILNSDHSNCTQYGSIDDGKTIQKSEEFHKVMSKTCEFFHLDTDIVFLDSNQQKYSMAGSIEVKGIMGSDKRMYLLDLLRLSPRDYNYQGENNQCCVLRYELLQNYWVVNTIQKIKQNNSDDPKTQQEAYQNIQNLLIGNPKEGLKLNPALGTKTILQQSEKLIQQEEDLKKLSQFLLNQAIPQLIQELAQPETTRHSDLSISDIFHSHGVNMRYLGKVISFIRSEEQPSLRLTLERVVFAKTLKHIFRESMRKAPQNQLSQVLSHLLNVIFSNSNTSINNNKQEEKKKKKKNKNKSTQNGDKPHFKCLIQTNNYQYPTYQEVWDQINKIAEARYQHKIDSSILNKKGFHKLSCLRELCQQIGLQLVARDYHEFQPSDIVGIQPIIKFIEQVSEDAKNNIEIGQKYMLEHQNLHQALESYLTASQIILNLHGQMHKELANCYSKISAVYLRKQEYEAAIHFQKQAIQIYTAIYGYDHPLTIQAITALSLYYFSTKNYKEAFNHMLHTLYLANLIGGEGQEVFNQYTNLSLLYSESGQHQSALNCLFEGLEKCESLFKSFQGTETQQYKLRISGYYSAIALEHGEIGDFQKAVEFQERASDLLKRTLKPEDTRVKEAEALLANLKKALNEKRKDTQQSNLDSRRSFGTNRNQLQKTEQQQTQQVSEETYVESDKEREALLQKLRAAKQSMKFKNKNQMDINRYILAQQLYRQQQQQQKE
ncbi:unnamed protein product [Paramecium pentaurelia]|uniref:Clustered mitochondria protein homolog n=1 Tax=Paramecium pentaurelia TaxID=43138 RepID=A0A8S1SAU0_9CILI|nr:unnamed protein product [Paramecium pentaurelia]